MTRNAITDVAGLKVGHAEDRRIASGVTAVLFDEPCIASAAIGGGAPGLRDAAQLEPGMTVERIDALVLSGGSAFGLDAMGGVQAFLRGQGKGFKVGTANVPIVPGAILFDLLNGGDKGWGQAPVYWHLGHRAAWVAGLDVAQGSVGAGLGATTANLKGGLGTASTKSSGGYTIGALVAVNALGSATVGNGPHFWAAPYERDGEFGGLGWPASMPPDALTCRVKGAAPSTTLAIVATDAALSKAAAKRFALMAQDGIGRALRPTHAALDGDIVFAVATGSVSRAPTSFDHVEIGTLGGDCLARAVARAVFEAEALSVADAQPSWHARFA